MAVTTRTVKMYTPGIKICKTSKNFYSKEVHFSSVSDNTTINVYKKQPIHSKYFTVFERLIIVTRRVERTRETYNYC